MRRSILVAAALLMTIPALGAAQSKDEPTKPATAAQKGKKATAAKKAAEPKKPLPRSPASPASPASKSSSTSKVSASAAADRAAMLRARATFRYAAEACTRGAAAGCDKDLLEDAQQSFILTCRTCAPVDKCEAEKALILEGKQNTTTDLCVP